MLSSGKGTSPHLHRVQRILFWSTFSVNRRLNCFQTVDDRWSDNRHVMERLKCIYFVVSVYFFLYVSKDNGYTRKRMVKVTFKEKQIVEKFQSWMYCFSLDCSLLVKMNTLTSTTNNPKIVLENDALTSTTRLPTRNKKCCIVKRA